MRHWIYFVFSREPNGLKVNTSFPRDNSSKEAAISPLMEFQLSPCKIPLLIAVDIPKVTALQRWITAMRELGLLFQGKNKQKEANLL